MITVFFEQLPHTADIKIRVYGATQSELFVNALKGMFQVVRPLAPECTVVDNLLVCDTLPIHHTITVNSFSTESLLVDFLSEALYLSDVYNEAYLDATIHEFTHHMISATLHGVKIVGFQVVELKAVTYHDLSIALRSDGVWQADLVFDI